MRFERRRIFQTMSVLLLAGCTSTQYSVQNLDTGNWRPKASPAPTSIQDVKPPQILPETHFAAGRMFESNKQYAKAIEQYRKAVAVNHSFVAGYHRLGLLLSQTGQREGALGAFRRAVTLQPNNPVLLNNLGFELLLNERWNDAHVQLERTVKLQPDFARARINLGIVLSKLNRFDESMAQFRSVLPEADACYNVGILYRGQKRYAEAAKLLRRVLEIDPEFSSAQLQLAQMGSHLEAANEMDRMESRKFAELEQTLQEPVKTIETEELQTDARSVRPESVSRNINIDLFDKLERMAAHAASGSPTTTVSSRKSPTPLEIYARMQNEREPTRKAKVAEQRFWAELNELIESIDTASEKMAGDDTVVDSSVLDLQMSPYEPMEASFYSSVSPVVDVAPFGPTSEADPVDSAEVSPWTGQDTVADRTRAEIYSMPGEYEEEPCAEEASMVEEFQHLTDRILDPWSAFNRAASIERSKIKQKVLSFANRPGPDCLAAEPMSPWQDIETVCENIYPIEQVSLADAVDAPIASGAGTLVLLKLLEEELDLVRNEINCQETPKVYLVGNYRVKANRYAGAMLPDLGPVQIYPEDTRPIFGPAQQPGDWYSAMGSNPLRDRMQRPKARLISDTQLQRRGAGPSAVRSDTTEGAKRRARRRKEESERKTRTKTDPTAERMMEPCLWWQSCEPYGDIPSQVIQDLQRWTRMAKFQVAAAEPEPASWSWDLRTFESELTRRTRTNPTAERMMEPCLWWQSCEPYGYLPSQVIQDLQRWTRMAKFQVAAAEPEPASWSWDLRTYESDRRSLSQKKRVFVNEPTIRPSRRELDSGPRTNRFDLLVGDHGLHRAPLR